MNLEAEMFSALTRPEHLDRAAAVFDAVEGTTAERLKIALASLCGPGARPKPQPPDIPEDWSRWDFHKLSEHLDTQGIHLLYADWRHGHSGAASKIERALEQHERSKELWAAYQAIPDPLRRT